MKKLTSLTALAIALAISPALAATAPADTPALSARARADLRVTVDRARATDGVAFVQVRDLLAHARESDQRARGRRAPIALRLSALGPRAVPALLDRLVFDGAPFAEGESAEQHAMGVRDVVEALGLLKDARALPVLSALATVDTDFTTSRTVAEALARLDRPEAAAALLAALGTARGDHALGLLGGMGACHEPSIARALADRLAAHPDAATAAILVKSLDAVGNAWAWKTLASRKDEAAVRATAAGALVDAYVHYTGDVRARASKALLVVDAPETPALLEHARKGAAPDLAAALDEMARRFEKNPTR